MRTRILICIGTLLMLAAYAAGTRQSTSADGYSITHGTVPNTYGKLSAVIADSIGTGLVFEDTDGTIRFVSVTGMKEGELARYDTNPVHGGIPKAYGHLAGAVVNHGQTGLVFQDAQGVIRFVTITGQLEAELTRN